MAQFLRAYARVAAFEGSYSNIRQDRGGETYAGIARVFFPRWAGWTLIDAERKNPAFPRVLDTDAGLHELVRQFYYEQFWEPLRGAAIAHEDTASELFEQAVNLGRVRAVKHMQRAVNVVSRSVTLAVDGIMGPNTLSGVNAVTDEPRRAVALITAMNILQGAHYINLIENDPSQEVFALGWLSRVTLTVA